MNTILSTHKIFGVVCLALLVSLVGIPAAWAASNPQVVTNAATNVQNNSAVLQGNLGDMGGDFSANVWFQWGMTASYGFETMHQYRTYAGSFSQQLYSLAPNTIFHFRAVAQNTYGTVYGQDMTFTTGQQNNQLPVANAGPNQYVNGGQQVFLQGSGYDPNGGNVTFSWTCNGGSLSNYAIAQPMYTAPYVGQYVQNSYTCTLTVTNNLGYSNSSSTTIYVNSQSGGQVGVQTNAATNISGNQATLNGYLSNFGAAYNVTAVWFQWGAGTGYGNETAHQAQNYSGSFSQNIAGLNPGSTYHFRALAQPANGQIVYGQDMTFVASGGYGYGTLTINKTAINLTSGNLAWATTVTANPFDILQFSLRVQAGSQDAHNVVVRDTIPSGLTYYNNVTVNGTGNSIGNDVRSGITIPVIPAGQAVTITYQAQVAQSTFFSAGTTTLTNNVSVTSSETGTVSDSATVVVVRSLLPAATNVSTGMTNGFFADSFFLPLVLLLLALWIWYSGLAHSLLRWAKQKLMPARA